MLKGIWKTLEKKKTQKWLALILIVAGLLVASYPLYLRYQSYREQEILRRDFYENVETQKENQSPDEEKDPEKKTLPEWEDWPDTRLEIPEISMEVYVDAVDNLDTFERDYQSPGYYPDSAFPGEEGNVTIAGHRTGPADYFRELHQLHEGDTLILRTPEINYHYQVKWVRTISSYDWSVVEPTDYRAITLTTCPLEGSQQVRERLVVRGELESVSFP